LFGEPSPPPGPTPAPKGKAKPDLPRKAQHAAGSDTSHAAAASLSEAVLGDLQLKVLEAIIACKDMTCDEVETHLDLSHQTASARINELAKAGYIEDSGQRRKTKHGRAAAVYVPTRKATE
jgi:predicted ArsR family transcriptional regulator